MAACPFLAKNTIYDTKAHLHIAHCFWSCCFFFGLSMLHFTSMVQQDLQASRCKMLCRKWSMSCWRPQWPQNDPNSKNLQEAIAETCSIQCVAINKRLGLDKPKQHANDSNHKGSLAGLWQNVPADLFTIAESLSQSLIRMDPIEECVDLLQKKRAPD